MEGGKDALGWGNSTGKGPEVEQARSLGKTVKRELGKEEKWEEVQFQERFRMGQVLQPHRTNRIWL